MRRLLLPFALLVLSAIPAQSLPKELTPFDARPLANAPAKPSAFDGKILVVAFWTSWCDVCEESLPSFIRIAEEYKAKGVQFIAISADEEKSDALSAVKERNYAVPSYWGKKATLKSRFKLTSVPTIIVYDEKEQALRFSGGGGESEEQLRATLTRLTAAR